MKDIPLSPGWDAMDREDAQSMYAWWGGRPPTPHVYGKKWHRAKCPICGYVAPKRATYQEALKDADDHYRVSLHHCDIISFYP